MGNFYSNILLRTADQKAVAELLAKDKRVAYISEPAAGYLHVYDEACEQNPDEIGKLAKKFSKRFGGHALAVINHDDDVLAYWLYQDGKKVDTYDSHPGFATDQAVPPAGGKADLLAKAFRPEASVEEIEALLRRSSRTGDEFFFEVERHTALARILGWDPDLCTLGYAMVDSGDVPGGDSMASVGEGPASMFRRRLARADRELTQAGSSGRLLAIRKGDERVPALSGSGPSLVAAWFDHREGRSGEFLGWDLGARSFTSVAAPGLSHLRRIATNRDGRWLAGVGLEGGSWYLSLVDRETGSVRFRTKQPGPVQDLVFASDDSRLHLLGKEYAEVGFDGEDIFRLDLGVEGKCLALHPDRIHAVVGTWNGIVVLDLEHRRRTKDLSCSRPVDVEKAYQALVAQHGDKILGNEEMVRAMLFQEQRFGRVTPFDALFPDDGRFLALATSQGLVVYDWGEVQGSDGSLPEPCIAHASPEYLPAAPPASMAEFVSTAGSSYAYSLLVDEPGSRILYGNLAGLVCWVDFRTGAHGVLLDVPGRPGIHQMEWAVPGDVLVLGTSHANPQGPRSPSLQAWSYGDLISDVAVVERRSGDSPS